MILKHLPIDPVRFSGHSFNFDLISPVQTRLATLARLAIAVLALLLASCAAPKVKRTVYPDGFMVITRSLGAIQTKHGGRAVYHKKASSIAGRAVEFPDNQFVKSNVRQVPCGPHDGFAFLVDILGLPDGVNEIDVELGHPLFLPPQDRFGLVKQRTEKIQSLNAKARWGFGWVFDSPSQQVPGKWTLRLRYRGLIIYEGSVEAVTPTVEGVTGL